MVDLKAVDVSSLSEFTSAVEGELAQARTRNPSAPSHQNWYRGLGLANKHKLVPSLYRRKNTSDLAELLRLEGKLFHEFRRQAVLLGGLDRFSTGEFGFEDLFILQHYAVPTRLLDWSSNPFIALYFALTESVKYPKSKESAVVWVLDPVAWNKRALEDISWGDTGPADYDESNIKAYRPRTWSNATEISELREFPIAILGKANNPRIFAQKGVFSVFGKTTSPMEQQYRKKNFPQDCLVKIQISKSKVAALLNQLMCIGFTDSVSYPDLHGLAMELKRLNGFEV